MYYIIIRKIFKNILQEVAKKVGDGRTAADCIQRWDKTIRLRVVKVIVYFPFFLRFILK